MVVPKYNPARTFTEEGTVGLGGAYMCIYPMDSPGGYQLVGRTLPIWNTWGRGAPFSPDAPWLLRIFDQVPMVPMNHGTNGTLQKYLNSAIFQLIMVMALHTHFATWSFFTPSYECLQHADLCIESLYQLCNITYCSMF